jgi:hypothetical protein
MQLNVSAKKAGNTVENRVKKFWYDSSQTVFLHSQKGKG